MSHFTLHSPSRRVEKKRETETDYTGNHTIHITAHRRRSVGDCERRNRDFQGEIRQNPVLIRPDIKSICIFSPNRFFFFRFPRHSGRQNVVQVWRVGVVVVVSVVVVVARRRHRRHCRRFSSLSGSSSVFSTPFQLMPPFSTTLFIHYFSSFFFHFVFANSLTITKGTTAEKDFVALYMI